MYSNVNPQVVILSNPGKNSKPEVMYIKVLCGRVAAQLLVNYNENQENMSGTLQSKGE